MRYPASEKLEIIRIVEQSHLPAKRTLDQLGIARRTFYRWYDRYLDGGPEALADRPFDEPEIPLLAGEAKSDNNPITRLSAAQLQLRTALERFQESVNVR